MIVTYHHIDEQPGFVTVAARDLADHLAWLSDQGMAVDLDTYLTHMLNGGDTTTMMAVTFDDGYTSFIEKALPLLERYEIPTTLFVPVGHVGGTNEWDFALTGTRLPLLDWDTLRTLATHPLVTIGSHGMTHCSMSILTSGELSDELYHSKVILEDRLGVTVSHFSFPYGQKRDIPIKPTRLLADTGYVSACSTRYGRRNTPADRYELRRIDIEPGDGIEQFIRKSTRRYIYKELKQSIKDIIRR